METLKQLIGSVALYNDILDELRPKRARLVENKAHVIHYAENLQSLDSLIAEVEDRRARAEDELAELRKQGCRHFKTAFTWEDIQVLGGVPDVCIKDRKHPKVCEFSRCQKCCLEFKEGRR